MRNFTTRELRQTNNRLLAANGKLQKQVGELKQQLQLSGSGQFKRGPKQRYCSVAGGLQLAARRGISNCGAYSLGLATGVDVHGTTVARYEAWTWQKWEVVF